MALTGVPALKETVYVPVELWGTKIYIHNVMDMGNDTQDEAEIEYRITMMSGLRYAIKQNA